MINVALIQPNVIQDWEKGYIDRIFASVKNNSELNRFKLVTNNEAADLIVLLESCNLKTQKDIKSYENILHFNQGNKRLCTLNYEDSPPGFLPGLYSSLEGFKFDQAIHISWPHLTVPNEYINKTCLNEEPAPVMLFTFSGSCSNPIRRKIFDFFNNNFNKYKINEIKRWYNHSENEKKTYVRDIRQSKFVLCPAGIASYSHRIIETLALRRVPVIIADNWEPFSIPEKDYYVRIKENSIADIIDILEQKENEYNRLQANAINVYTKYFDPGICYSVALNQLTNLYTNKLLNISPDFLKKRWNSRKFWKVNKWCIENRIARKVNKIAKSFSN